MKKILKSRIFVFVLGLVISGSIGVYAAIKIQADEIGYKDGTVEDALNDLYEKTKNIQTGNILYSSLQPNSGWSYKSVTFDKSFENIPDIYIIPNDGSGNGYYVRNVTVNGFELGIFTSSYTHSSMEISWMAID